MEAFTEEMITIVAFICVLTGCFGLFTGYTSHKRQQKREQQLQKHIKSLFVQKEIE